MYEAYKVEFGSAPVQLDSAREYIFTEKVKAIREHNADASQTYKKGLNKFSAMTWAEVSEYLHLSENQANAEQNCSATVRGETLSVFNGGAPDSWDWRNKGGVSPVKD